MEVFNLPTDRFGDIAGKESDKPTKEQCEYKSVAVAKPPVPSDQLSSAQGDDTDSTTGSGRLNSTYERAKALPASFDTFIKAIKHLNTFEGFSAKMREPDELTCSDRNWKDVIQSGLWANADPIDFYKRVQTYIDALHTKGMNVDFIDCTTNPASTLGIKITAESRKLTIHNISWEVVENAPEPAVVQILSQLLKEHFTDIYPEDIAWMAFKEEIWMTHARKIYGNASMAQIAIHWVKLAKEGKLDVSFALPHGLSIKEKSKY